jgi:hypothetical protein
MKKLSLFLSVLLLLVSSGAWSQTAPFLLHRVNAGGQQIVDDTLSWFPDTRKNPAPYLLPSSPNYTAGAATWRGVNTTGAPDAIFGPNRYGQTEWYFAVTPGEYYRVSLYFAESPYASGVHAVGQRIFDVYVDNELILDNFDIYATAGLNAIRRSFTVKATHTRLYIFFMPEQGSLRSPQVNGIQIEASPVLMPKPFDISGITYPDRVILNWNDTSVNKTGFEIHRGYYDEAEGVVKFSALGTVDANTTTFTDTTVNVPGPCPPPFIVYYKIRTLNGSDASLFNSFYTGSFDALPGPVDTIFRHVKSNEVSLAFVDNITYAYSYGIYRSTFRSGPYSLVKTLSTEYNHCSGDTLRFADPDLLPATTYYYYVESQGAFYTGANSDTLALTTLSETNAALRNRETVKVYPNPAETIVSVQINNAREQEVYIEIVDKVGLPRYRTRKRLESGKADVDIGSLETGIYILHVTSSSGKETFRLVKQ